MYHFKRALKSFLGRDLIGRNFTVLPSDVLLVSYPRSGNTWTRFMLANLLGHNDVGFSTIERIIPDIYQNYDSDIPKSRRDRILKSHEPFDPRYNRVIYLVRDPRDVLVSFFYYHKKKNAIDENESIESYMQKFLSGDVAMQSKIGSWGEHVGSWMGARGADANFTVIRYEDMADNPYRELSKLNTFLGLNKSAEAIEQATSNSSFNLMRKSEERHSKNWATTKGSRKDIPFVRKGKPNGWIDELTLDQGKQVVSFWSSQCNELGYE